MVAGIGIQSFDKPLSASIGVAHFPADGADAERLLAEADRQMYIQKRDRKQDESAPPQRKLWETPWDATTVH